MSDLIRFFVPGIPAPGGSKRGFLHKRTNRVIVTEDCRRSKDWRATVALCATEAIKEPLSGPVELRIAFWLLRPKGHYGTGRNTEKLKESAPEFPTTKPDCTKLLRSTEDALKGIAWHDDAQVVRQCVTKAYSQQAGAWITVCPMGRPNA